MFFFHILCCFLEEISIVFFLTFAEQVVYFVSVSLISSECKLIIWFYNLFQKDFFFLIEVSMPFVIQGFFDLVSSSLVTFFNGAFLSITFIIFSRRNVYFWLIWPLIFSIFCFSLSSSRSLKSLSSSKFLRSLFRGLSWLSSFTVSFSIMRKLGKWSVIFFYQVATVAVHIIKIQKNVISKGWFILRSYSCWAKDVWCKPLSG